MPFPSLLPAAIGAAGTIAGAAISSTGGGSEEVSGLTLPPEFEVQLVNTAQDNLNNFNQEFERISQLENAFNQRLSTLEGIIEGTIPQQEGLQALTQNSLDIARGLGQNAQELVAGGLLTEADAADLQALQDLESQDFQDPVLEGQLSDERARLQQDLARQGVSPAAQAQALAQFDRRAQESRFTRAEELRTGRFGRISSTIGLRSGLREQGFQQATGTLGALTQQQDFARQGAAGLAQLAQSRFTAGQQAIASRQGLRQERQDLFQNLGQFNLSGRTRSLLRGGRLNTQDVTTQIATGQLSRGRSTTPNRTRLRELQSQFGQLNEGQFRQKFNRFFEGGRGRGQESEDLQEAFLNEATRRGII